MLDVHDNTKQEAERVIEQHRAVLMSVQSERDDAVKTVASLKQRMAAKPDAARHMHALHHITHHKSHHISHITHTTAAIGVRAGTDAVRDVPGRDPHHAR